MKYAMALAALTYAAIAGCANVPPAGVAEVHARYPQALYKAGKFNCNNFMARYMVDLTALGYQPQQQQCKVNMYGKAVSHTYVTVNGWALDNRFKAPTQIENVGCIQ